MSLARLKRLQKLEARRRPPGVAWVDPFPVVMRLMVDAAAVAAGRAEWIPRFGPEVEAVGLYLREADRTAERLRARAL